MNYAQRKAEFYHSERLGFRSLGNPDNLSACHFTVVNLAIGEDWVPVCMCFGGWGFPCKCHSQLGNDPGQVKNKTQVSRT